ncbi:MAG: ribosomal RNA small subunit methyltransferase A [Candidatus Bathyarchaeota archaeon]|nr:MAG: ribosomal RNA small subunit methyltransferase A [Candidatus Bathyarchaeota archaeon]
MSLLEEAKQLIHLHKFSPKRGLGQNFAVDMTILRRMISFASVDKEDVVLEIGAGLGFLTRLLCEECKQVIAIEIDSRLVEILRSQLRGLENVDLIEGDALRIDIPLFDKVVSTPPYSISSSMLFWLLGKPFSCAVLTFQREFAKRLTAHVGDKDYGRLTISAYYRADVELLTDVSRKTFYPSPDVESTIVRLKPRAPPFHVENEFLFFSLLRTLFMQPNKKVRNAIIPFLRNLGVERDDAMNRVNSLLLYNRRVRQLTPEDFGDLANEFA